jgi:hypothetical protein
MQATAMATFPMPKKAAPRSCPGTPRSRSWRPCPFAVGFAELLFRTPVQVEVELELPALICLVGVSLAASRSSRPAFGWFRNGRRGVGGNPVAQESVQATGFACLGFDAPVFAIVRNHSLQG